MTCEDWRNLRPQEIAPLLDAERCRWLTELGWETASTWATVEEARALGRLPGLIVRDDAGRIVGWTFYLLHDDMVQIGALVGAEARVLRLLLDELLQVPEAAYAERVSLFVLPEQASLMTALTRRRFAMRGHHYLTRPLTPGVTSAGVLAPSNVRLRTFRPSDEAPLVRALAEAYQGLPSAECFAPHGRLNEWAWYARQLLRTPTCGTLVPDATFVAERPDVSGLAGVVLTTSVSQTTAHIAQIVVAPAAQGTGVGAALLDAAMGEMQSRGATRVTLMVSDDNARARALYATAGFTPGPTFLYAARPLPKRLARAS